ncbi:MAG: hypothetical protein LC624_08295 [Halobacteriales archaeon]|nr:hypothetical protein [Halobacteriales archaeon]
MHAIALLDADDNELTLDALHPLAFGNCLAGSTSDALRLRVLNVGEQPVDFVRVRAVVHPEYPVGALQDTVDAVRIGLSPRGPWFPEVELGTLRAGEARSVWVQWLPPVMAMPGDVVFAVTAVGAPREEV